MIDGGYHGRSRVIHCSVVWVEVLVMCLFTHVRTCVVFVPLVEVVEAKGEARKDAVQCSMRVIM